MTTPRRVVAGPAADFVEPGALVHRMCQLVGRPHLQEHAFGVMPARKIEHALQQIRAVPAALVQWRHAHIEDVRFARSD
jgi:hypothetical protein